VVKTPSSEARIAWRTFCEIEPAPILSENMVEFLTERKGKAGKVPENLLIF